MPRLWDGLKLLPGDLPADMAGVLRTLRYGNPDFEVYGVLTFKPHFKECPIAQWEDWCDGIFRPILRPALCRALRQASADHARELAASDAALDAVLPAAEARRSREAGRRLLRDFPPPPAARPLARLQDAFAAGTLAGHYATVFAARCALFSIGGRAAATAYLFQEWDGGTGGRIPVNRAPDFARGAGEGSWEKESASEARLRSGKM